MALKANLDAKTATLREAQLSLSDTEGKLHEEYEKNFEMGRENNYLQADVDRLSQENEQMEQVCGELLGVCAGQLQRITAVLSRRGKYQGSRHPQQRVLCAGC